MERRRFVEEVEIGGGEAHIILIIGSDGTSNSSFVS